MAKPKLDAKKIVLAYSGGLDTSIILKRLKNEYGAEDGKCVPLAGNPNSADGARTTFQGLDEPLALDTEVPTPEGWKNIGDLEAGDQVFDRWGEPVKVSGV